MFLQTEILPGLKLAAPATALSAAVTMLLRWVLSFEGLLQIYFRARCDRETSGRMTTISAESPSVASSEKFDAFDSNFKGNEGSYDSPDESPRPITASNPTYRRFGSMLKPASAYAHRPAVSRDGISNRLELWFYPFILTYIKKSTSLSEVVVQFVLLTLPLEESSAVREKVHKMYSKRKHVAYDEMFDYQRNVEFSYGDVIKYYDADEALDPSALFTSAHYHGLLPTMTETASEDVEVSNLSSPGDDFIMPSFSSSPTNVEDRRTLTFAPEKNEILSVIDEGHSQSQSLPSLTSNGTGEEKKSLFGNVSPQPTDSDIANRGTLLSKFQFKSPQAADFDSSRPTTSAGQRFVGFVNTQPTVPVEVLFDSSTYEADGFDAE